MVVGIVVGVLLGIIALMAWWLSDAVAERNSALRAMGNNYDALMEERRANLALRLQLTDLKAACKKLGE